MKMYICASKHFYSKIAPIKETLERAGHRIILPNSYDDPFRELRAKEESKEVHRELKTAFLRDQKKKVAAADALLILNFEKNGIPNYIGGATFLEIYQAWDTGKKIFLFNPIPKGILEDELLAMNPVIIHGDLSLVR